MSNTWTFRSDSDQARYAALDYAARLYPGDYPDVIVAAARQFESYLTGEPSAQDFVALLQHQRDQTNLALKIAEQRGREKES